MTARSSALTHESVVVELKAIREKSLGALRKLRLPALHEAAHLAGMATTDRQPEPAAIEVLLRKAVEHLDGGHYQEAAEFTFGLVGGTKLALSTERRRQAARVFHVAPETFRKKHEKLIIEQTAEGVLALCHEEAMRTAHLQMEKRHPADTRLAVAWVERFEAYYRVWTPVYALASDLRAALRTYSEEPADHLPWDPNSEKSYDPLHQARGYARSALFWYTRFLLELRRFMNKHGGLWLLSDTTVEERVSDAVYRIGWHNPISEENDSWLRRALADSRYEEAEVFYSSLVSTNMGERTAGTWQRFVNDGYEAEQAGDTAASQVHSTIEACDDYTKLIDEDWLKIADWYSPGAKAPRGIDGQQLYEAHLRGLTGRRVGLSTGKST